MATTQQGLRARRIRERLDRLIAPVRCQGCTLWLCGPALTAQRSSLPLSLAYRPKGRDGQVLRVQQAPGRQGACGARTGRRPLGARGAGVVPEPAAAAEAVGPRVQQHVGPDGLGAHQQAARARGWPDAQCPADALDAGHPRPRVHRGRRVDAAAIRPERRRDRRRHPSKGGQPAVRQRARPRAGRARACPRDGGRPRSTDAGEGRRARSCLGLFARVANAAAGARAAGAAAPSAALSAELRALGRADWLVAPVDARRDAEPLDECRLWRRPWHAIARRSARPGPATQHGGAIA